MRVNQRPIIAPSHREFNWHTFAVAATTLSLVLFVGLIKVTRRDCLITVSGTLKATRVVSRDGKIVQLYRAVPFGQTTSGSGRFGRPRPLDFIPWTQCSWLAPRQPGSPCTQLRSGGVLVGSEDCLNMDVWAPVAASGFPRRTVVFVVTGDWFQHQYNADADWADLTARGDFVVAAPNYRVGAFGFLNPGVGGAVGNAAIEDLLLALSWLQKNVWKFHGDPEDIVALGLGSGAFLLSIILMSPEFNVFKRAFLQGPYPTSLIPLNTPQHGEEYVAAMARFLGCPEDDVSAQIDCLRSATEEDVMKSTINVTARMPFVPSSFYGVDLMELHKRAVFGEVKLMLGSDRDDARALFQRLVPVGDFYRRNYDPAYVFAYFLRAMKGLELETFELRYKPRGLVEMESIPELDNYIADLWTVCFPRIIADEAAAKNGTVYRYIIPKRAERPFRTVFDVDVIAGFLKNATVPSLKNGQTWLPYETGRRFTVNATNGAELVEASYVNCGDMDDIPPLLRPVLYESNLWPYLKE